jgi:hypothetical protein
VDELEPLPETLQLIYDHTNGGPSRQAVTADAIDQKAFQAFSAGSVVLGFAAFVGRSLTAPSAALYAAGVVMYVVVSVASWKIVHRRAYEVVDAADRWWPSHKLADTDVVLSQMLDDLAEAATYNRDLLNKKGGPLDYLMWALAAEAVLVAAAA